LFGCSLPDERAVRDWQRRQTAPTCLANTGPRRFIVCDVDIKPLDRHGNPTIYAPLIDKWTKCGVTIQDAAAAILTCLSEHGPLVMVVHSGNVSLQGWFFCAGEDEDENSNLRSFFQSAVILGCDRAGWTRCQFFRMPGATRPETRHRQSVHYFDPSVLADDDQPDDEPEEDEDDDETQSEDWQKV
jgi:hypothetical protein